MALRAYNIETGAEVHCGDTVTSFRGETATLDRCERANEIGRDGKVAVTWTKGPSPFALDYYARVFGLTVRDE